MRRLGIDMHQETEDNRGIKSGILGMCGSVCFGDATQMEMPCACSRAYLKLQRPGAASLRKARIRNVDREIALTKDEELEKSDPQRHKGIF
jgi:hypothetical protein